MLEYIAGLFALSFLAGLTIGVAVDTMRADFERCMFEALNAPHLWIYRNPFK